MRLLFVVLLPPGLIAQAAVPEQFQPWLTLANIGVAGVWIWTLTRERNEMRAELRERNKEDREQLIPLMARNTDALTRVVEVLSERKGR